MDEQEKREEHRLKKERVVRWDKYRIEYFTYTYNIFLGLNLGFIGFFITQTGFEFKCPPLLALIQGLTIILLIISFFTGTYAVLNRLKDFRQTSKLTKERKKIFEFRNRLRSNLDGEGIQSKIDELERVTRRHGNKTWRLLDWQIYTFVLGTTLGVFIL